MKTERLTTLSVLLALSVIGANFKIFGSIALDSFPAFLGSALLGPAAGAMLGAVGHLLSALLAGWPLTLPIHLAVAAIMAITMFSYGKVRRLNKFSLKTRIIASDVIGLLLNVVLSLIVLMPFIGRTVALSLWLPLMIGTVVNLLIADSIYAVLSHYNFKKRRWRS